PARPAALERSLRCADARPAEASRGARRRPPRESARQDGPRHRGEDPAGSDAADPSRRARASASDTPRVQLRAGRVRLRFFFSTTIVRESRLPPARRRVRISRLAPTGEGISRGEHGVGFVAGALPGEEVEAEVEEKRRTFWRGRAVEILVASRDRVCRPGESCPGCDWGHFEPAAAREAKRALFLETMQRIGKLPVPAFGELPIVASPPGYRIRNRFHLEGRGADLSLGQFAARWHRVGGVAGGGA